jgi:acyl-CoA thioesterase FadM
MIRSILKLTTSKVDTEKSIPYYEIFEYFELARIKLLEEIGLDQNTMVDNDIHFLISTAKASYITMLRSHEEIEVVSEIRDIHHNRLQVVYIVRRGENEIDEIAEGKTVHSFVNAGGRKLRIPGMVQDILHKSWGDDFDDE